MLLDAVVDYLPNPTEKENVAMDRDNGEAEVRAELWGAVCVACPGVLEIRRFWTLQWRAALGQLITPALERSARAPTSHADATASATFFCRLAPITRNPPPPPAHRPY